MSSTSIFAAGTLNYNNTLYYYSGSTPLSSYDEIIIDTNTVAGGFTPLQGFGIYGNNYTLKNVTITTKGSTADAIQVNAGGLLQTYEKLTINAYGSSADGINVTENVSGLNSTVRVGNGSYIYSQDGVGVRANIAKTVGVSSIIEIGDNLEVITGGSGSNLLDSKGYGIYAGIRSWTASSAVGEARVTIGNNSKITTNGSSAHAIYANRGGVIQLGSTEIETKQANAYGIFAEAGSAGGVTRGSVVDLLGDTKVTVVNNGYAMQATGAGSVISSNNSDTGTRTSGVYTVTGNMRAQTGGKIDLNMTNGSVFLGNTTVDANSTLNLNISGTNSLWRMSNSSTVTDLKVSGATIQLGDQTSTVIPSNKVTLTAKTLEGSGTFVFRSEIDGSNNHTDFLVIDGVANGNHKTTVNDSLNGGSTVTGDERIHIIKTEGGNANFTISNASGTVDVGAYQYGLSTGDTIRSERTSDWYLTSQRGLTNTADNSANILNISYLLNYVENQTLLQRMGELRRSPNMDGDVWGRVYAGALTSFGSQALSDSKVKYQGMQIGVDKKFVTEEDYDIYGGAVVGLSRAYTDFQEGDGSTNSYYVGFYGTYKHVNGFYVDGVAKYLNMNNSFNTTTSGGYSVYGDGDSKGFSLSLETGKRFYFTEQPTVDEGRWYVEPQAQITYSHQSAATISSSNGLKTNLGSYESVIGRVSALLGYTTYDKNNNQVDIYVKTGYVKEFEGNTTYAFNGMENNSYNFKGHMIDNAVGVNAQIDNVHNLYIDFTYAKGNQFDQTMVNLGYRYNF
ncbi:autotransporter outer membrane beta-barrel domain-containing protein [Zophobihabitans entericus]|uniref:Autotransporter outer membrane beta-barrel domain-containing protein n=1 Tax=Zophobihabitans entericus TaxID=1635327 RepID=A0A6G9IE86_9GAMM|nr:autotransporter outer membrane beta-barrel domain-containing protein [Zophobihabitans entericus]QIQ22004.1 autotransporter outer membrane beta-barrel domain-containing protein [Zophobihabitans entericus]